MALSSERMTKLQRRAEKLRSTRRLNDDVRGLTLPRNAIVFDNPTNDRAFRPYGLGVAFCFHDRLYWMPCRQCRRTSERCEIEAKRFRERVRQHYASAFAEWGVT